VVPKTRNQLIAYGQQLAADGIHLEPCPSEQAVIALAREYRQAGLSSRKIAARLAEQGFHNRVGKPFNPATVLDMVAERE